jgi:hypothetical protein
MRMPGGGGGGEGGFDVQVGEGRGEGGRKGVCVCLCVCAHLFAVFAHDGDLLAGLRVEQEQAPLGRAHRQHSRGA